MRFFVQFPAQFSAHHSTFDLEKKFVCWEQDEDTLAKAKQNIADCANRLLRSIWSVDLVAHCKAGVKEK